MPYVNVGKENSGTIDLYYEDHGSGKPIVLIHGWPLSGASWEKQVRALLQAGRRVITYDRRGFGRSSQPTLGYEYDTLALDLHKIITTLELEDVTIAGFSMGGGEVARYLSAYGTDRVGKAAFISAIPPFLQKTSDNPDGVDKSLFDGIESALLADRPAFLSQFFVNFYNTDVLSGKLISDEVVRNSWNIAVAASSTATHACVAAWLTDFRKDLAGIEIPILVIHGGDDRILPIEATGILTAKRVKGARLVTIEGGPHGCIWTHAEQVNSALLGFIK